MHIFRLGCFLALSAILLVFSPSAHATTCVSLPTNAVGWWAFETNLTDRVSGSVAAFSGAENYLTGKVGKAIELDGFNEYVIVGSNTLTHIADGAGFTVECWIKPLEAGRPIIEWTHGSEWGAHLWISGDGGVYANFRAGTFEDIILESAGGLVQLDVWQHVAVTFVKTNGLGTVYLNGAIVGQQVLGARTPDTTGIMEFGHSVVHGGYFFKGEMDEMTTYKRALSAAEIQSIYNAAGLGKCVSGAAPIIITQPESITTVRGSSNRLEISVIGTQPLSYQWFFGNSKITSATNTSLVFPQIGTNNSGNYYAVVTNAFGAVTSSIATVSVTDCLALSSNAAGLWPFDGSSIDFLTGAAANIIGTTNYSVGKVNSAIILNGSTRVVVGTNANSNLAAAEGFTVECWIKPAVFGRPIVEWNNGSVWGAHFWIAGSGALFANLRAGSFEDVTLESGGNVVALGAWHHVALTYVKSNGLATIYANGIQVAQQAFGTRTPDTTGTLEFGHSVVHGGYFFEGGIDEMTTYKRALRPGEIQAIHAAGEMGKCGGNVAPVITVHPQSFITYSGTSNRLTVSAYGSQPLFYQWFFASEKIASATNSSLVFPQITPNDSGNYYAVVSNAFGMATSLVATVMVTECLAVSSNLVGWWGLDNNVLDYKGTNIAVVTGTTRFTNGFRDTALNFDGVNNRLTVAGGKDINVGTNAGFTIEGWIKPSDISVSRPVFDWHNGAQSGVQLWITVGASRNLFANMKRSNGTDNSFQSPGNLVQTNVWQHVALSYLASSGTATIHLNGQVVAQQSLGTYTPQTSYNLVFGHSVALGGRFFIGQLDEMALHNRALLTEEIQVVAGRCKPAIAPQILVHPQDAVLFAGSSTNLNVTASGYPLEYRWFFGTNRVSGETNSSLALSNVGTNSSGQYYATVSNAAGGQISRSAIVQVLPIGAPLVVIGGKTAPRYQFTNSSAQVQIQSTLNNASIFYTTDGTEADFNGIPYSGPFLATNSQTIRAVAYDSNFSAKRGLPVSLSFYFTLVASSPGGGTVERSPSQAAYLDSEIVQLNAQPSSQWSFLKWTGDAAGTSPIIQVPMNRAKTIQAIFGTAVSTSANGIGDIRLNPDTLFHAYGSLVQAIAVPGEGHYFALWGGNAAGNTNPYTFTVTNTAPEISALFAELPPGRFALTVIPNGAGTIAVSPRANSFTNGQVVTVTATPMAGQQFYRWGGDAESTNNPFTVIMDRSKSLTADFSGGIYPLSLSPSTISSNQEISFSILGEPRAPLAIQFSTNLLHWSELGKITNGSNGSFEFKEPASNFQRFYRAVQN